MSDNWQKVYTELKDFIAGHPEVEVGTYAVSIPESFRSEFYRLFDIVRAVFVEDKFLALLGEIQVLDQNYTKVEEEVTELLGLEDISTPPSLHRFLHDPKDWLTRELFNPLFDLLKGKSDIQTFEEKVSRNVAASFSLLYRTGYEKWVLLSLVKLLEADKSFQVIIPHLDSNEIIKNDPNQAGMEVPPPRESKSLSFNRVEELMFVVPDFIVHSTRIDRYVGARSEYQATLAKAANASKDREWYPLDSAVPLEPGLTLIYVASKPEDISLVADYERVCKPDLIVESKGQKGWDEKVVLEKVRLYRDMLKPRLGSYVVSREAISEPGVETQEDNIHLLMVGFDASKLAPIVDAFVVDKDNDQ